jgi:putative ABC transport system permease protein
MYPRYLRKLHARAVALLAGAGGHGYELKQTLEHEFGQLLPALNAGQIYSTLARLERDGLITGEGVAGDSRRKRVYGLTERGRAELAAWIEGSRPREGGIVLERSLASALHLRVGSRLRFAAPGGSITLPVVGTAISPSQPRYPRSNPGLAWVTRAAFERIEPDRSRWTWTQAVRLTDPATAPAFATRAAAVGAPGPFLVRTWEQQREEALRDTQPLTIILMAYTIVLLVVVFAVVAILVGARPSTQHREIGLLKAVGLTPRQITIAFALESAALGLIAVVIGFAVGAVLAPRLAAPTAETLLASPTTAASPWHLLVASCPVVLVLVASARASTRRSTRFSVLQAIQSGAGAPASRSRLARAIGRLSLPLPLALGLKDLVAQPHRALRLAGAIAVTGAGIVFALSMKATLDAVTGASVDDVPDELPVLVYTLDAVLLVITATTLVAVALLTVRERIRDYSVLKTVGLTPRQVAWSLVGAVYALVGADADDLVLAPWWWLALVPVGALPVIAGVTSLPARLATRIPSAQALRYE